MPPSFQAARQRSVRASLNRSVLNGALTNISSTRFVEYGAGVCQSSGMLCLPLYTPESSFSVLLPFSSCSLIFAKAHSVDITLQ